MAHTCALRKPVFQQTGATAPKEAGNSPEEYARIHGEFMTMVHDLIDGSLESSAYEDHCRALLGERLRMQLSCKLPALTCLTPASTAGPAAVSSLY